MLGKIEGKRRRGYLRMRWLDSITNAMDTNLGKFQEMVWDREMVCCSLWSLKDSDKTGWLNNNNNVCVCVSVQFSSVQSLSRVRLFATPWIAARQASMSITNSRSSLRLASIESVMPSSHLIFFCPLLLLPAIPPSIRVFCNESTLRMRCPKYWSFSFSIIPSKEIPGLISFRMD